MYAEYYDSELFDWELAITFERKERGEYSAYITGLPQAYWNSEAQQWEVEVCPEIPRKVTASRSHKAARPRFFLRKRVLQRPCY